MSRADELSRSLAVLERRLVAACAAAGRPRAGVVLVAVTKTHSVEDIATLAALGIHDVGENRDQEAAVKAAALRPVLPSLRWHFVGAVQTNKAANVAAYADVVHSVDRASLVRALSVAAVRAGRELAVLLQVSLDGDPARGGVVAGELAALADQAAAANGLRLAGVMAVAPLGIDPAVAFTALAEVAARLRVDHPDAVQISAGMSSDLESAIAAGATYVRVGTALLGPRPPVLR